jgi:hypothetical protein
MQYMGRIRGWSFPLLIQIESRGGEFEGMLPETLWDVGPFSDKMHFEISFLSSNITIIVLIASDSKRKLKIEAIKGT